MGLSSGSHVILRDHRGHQKVVALPHSSTQHPGELRFGKLRIPASLLLEQGGYGKTFRCNGNSQWEMIPHSQLLIEQIEEGTNIDDDHDSENDLDGPANNQKLNDSNASQILSAHDINRMKAEGLDSQELIQSLVKNSKTFSEKTKFSQAKYIKKKRAKHLKQFTIRQPTLMDLAETHLIGDFKRIGGLRFDYLSAMLSYGNIRAGSTVLVIDNTGGLLTAGVIQRLAGSGCVYRVTGAGLGDIVLHEMDFSEEYLKVLHDIPLSFFQELIHDTITVETLTDLTHTLHEHSWLRKGAEQDEKGSKKKLKDSSELHQEQYDARQIACNERQKHRIQLITHLFKYGVEAMLVSLSPGCRNLETSLDEARFMVLKIANRFLNPDGRFVFFSLSHSHAAANQIYLMKSNHYFAIRLEELFLREYQVLPFRTHPIMALDCRLFSGFLLTAIRFIETKIES